MSTDAWQQAEEIFERLIVTPPAERAAVLEEACGDDAALRAEVESLLEHDDRAGPCFLASPVLDWHADVRNPHRASAAMNVADTPNNLDPSASDPRPPDWARALIGQQLGRYTVMRVVGRGGMGCVFEARQEQPARSVALKVLQPGLAAASALARFRLEPEVLGRLQHPYIAQVFEAGVHNSDSGLVPYFAMELIPDAQPLIEYANANDLSVRASVELFAKVCDAVEHGHQRDIIHRDLKPANILVRGDGEPKVIDFGVARSTDADIMLTTQHTRVGDLIGTVHYMSPEQCDGQPAAIDARSDVYTLGVVLYELLTGVAPYDTGSTTLYAAVRTIKEEQPRRPSEVSRRFRGDVEAILLKALEKEPTRRYQSAAALADDLRRHLAGEPVGARVPSLAYRVGRFVQRRPWQAGMFAASVLVLVLAVATVLVAKARNDERRARALAEVGAYGAKLGAADAAIGVGDVRTARMLLEHAQQDSPALCGWEWRHLMSRLDQSLHTLPAPEGFARQMLEGDLAISPDGERIAVARGCGTVEIVSRDGTIVSTLFRPELAGLRSCRVAWSHDAELLAATTSAGVDVNGNQIVQLMVWRTANLAQRKPDVCWRIGKTCIGSLAFHPQRRLLATDGWDGEHGLIQLWDLEDVDGLVQRGAPPPPVVVQGTGGVHECIAWCPDGTFLVSACHEEKYIDIWDVAQAPQRWRPKPVTTLCDHRYHMMDIAFNPQHPRILASASLDRTVRLWDLTSLGIDDDAELAAAGPPIKPFDVLRGHANGATAVSFDRYGRRLFTGGWDRTVHVWDVEWVRERNDLTPRRTQTNTLLGHEGRISRLGALEGGRVASVSPDGTLRIWAPDVEAVSVLRGHLSSVHQVAFAPDGQGLFSVCGQARVYDWDVATGTPHRWWCLDGPIADLGIWSTRRGVGWVLAHAANPQPRVGQAVFAVPGDGDSLDIVRRLIVETRQHPRQIVLSSDQTRLIVGNDAGQMYVWSRNEDDQDWGTAQTYAVGGLWTTAIAALDDSARWVAVCVEPADESARSLSFQVWDFRTGRLVSKPLEERDSGAQGCRLALNRDRSLLALGTVGGTIHLFRVHRRADSVELEAAGDLRGHTDRLSAMAFHPSEWRLVSSVQDDCMKVWDLRTLVEVATFRGHPVCAASLAFDPSGELLATGSMGALGGDNVVRLWGTGLTSEQKAARAIAARAYSEAVRHINDGDDPDRAVELIRNDRTLPEDVRRFAAEELRPRIAPSEVRDEASP